MFTNKSHINTLVAALIAGGVRHVVACPGSRNAPIIHDCYEAELTLHPVTDERSAGFVAIGLSLSQGIQPVAVCVTSGSALLNLLPSVSEAYYRQIPLLIISADRPAEWTGHLDGQTLPQVGALNPYTPTFVLDEGAPAEAVLQQSLAALRREGGRPVHLNVHIYEPLFGLTHSKLGAFVSKDTINTEHPAQTQLLSPAVCQVLSQSRHPILVIGAYEHEDLRDIVAQLSQRGVRLFADIHSQIDDGGRLADYERQRETAIETDLIIHIGGAFVGKYLKLALRREAMAHNITVIRIDETDDVADTFRGNVLKVTLPPAVALKEVARYLAPQLEDSTPYQPSPLAEPAAPKSATIFRLGKVLTSYATRQRLTVFLANSTTPRIVSATRTLRPGRFPIYINRGVNGIEGCTSVAAGYALGAQCTIVLITGDLSFFYDANALWNTRLRGNLRIVLLNDQCGGIFAGLPSFDQSPALHDYIAAAHTATAQGIATSYDCGYTRVDGVPDTETLKRWLEAPATRPQILEVIVART